MHVRKIVSTTLLSAALMATMVGCKKEEAKGKEVKIDKTKSVLLIGTPKVKEEIATSEFSMDNMKINMQMEGMKLDGSMSQKQKSKIKYEYISADSVYCTVIYDSTFENSNMGGEVDNKALGSPLEGLKVLKTKTGDTWTFVEDAKLTNDQKDALADLDANSTETNNEFYTDKEVKVGDTWDVKADAFKDFLGDGASAVKGDIKMALKDIVEYEGQPCAVVEGTVKIGGDVEGQMNMNLDTKVTLYRSLQTFKDLKMDMTGSVKGSMKAMNMTMAGDLKATQSSVIK